MDVTCDRCRTEYEFDETLVSARGTTVKCSNCGHLFKVFPSNAQADAPKRWRLRRKGSRHEEILESLRDLQDRISKGDLARDDEITREDDAWKPLGSIAELEPFFAQASNMPKANVVPPHPREPKGTLLGVTGPFVATSSATQSATPSALSNARLAASVPPPISARAAEIATGQPMLSDPPTTIARPTSRLSSAVKQLRERISSIPPLADLDVLKSSRVPAKSHLLGLLCALLVVAACAAGWWFFGEATQKAIMASSEERVSSPALVIAKPAVPPAPPVADVHIPPTAEAAPASDAQAATETPAAVIENMAQPAAALANEAAPPPAPAPSPTPTPTPPPAPPEPTPAPAEVQPAPAAPVEPAKPVADAEAKPVAAQEKAEKAKPEKPKAAKPVSAKPAATKPSAEDDTKLESGTYESFLAKGQKALAANQLDSARSHFERALEESPSSGDATVGLGDVARKSGNAALAVRYYYAAARRGAKIAYFRMAQVYEQQNRLDDAISGYHTYLVRDPGGSFAAQAQTRLDALLAKERQQENSAGTTNAPTENTAPSSQEPAK